MFKLFGLNSGESQVQWISRYLSTKQIQEISDYVQATELKTMGEIVPVIVRRSSAIRHVPLAVALSLMLFVVLLDLPYLDLFFHGAWTLAWPVLFLLFYVVGLLMARCHWVQRVFVPNQDEVDQVEDRAEREFFLNRVHLTEGKTGILIFVSVMERRAVILADTAINEKVGPEEWDSILHDLTARLKEGSWDLAFKEAIARCGAVLAKHFPAQKQNPNEITNHLIIKN